MPTVETKAAKRRARKLRVMAKLVADGKDFSEFDQHQKFTQSTYERNTGFLDLPQSDNPIVCPT